MTAVFEEVVANDVALHDSSSLPPAPDDPFTVLVCTLADVADPGGVAARGVPPSRPALRRASPRAARRGRPKTRSGPPVSCTAPRSRPRSWRSRPPACAILRGTSDDFDACGASMLDEWAADSARADARHAGEGAFAPSGAQEPRRRRFWARGLEHRTVCSRRLSADFRRIASSLLLRILQYPSSSLLALLGTRRKYSVRKPFGALEPMPFA